MDKHTVQRYKNNNIILCAIKTSRTIETGSLRLSSFRLGAILCTDKDITLWCEKIFFYNPWRDGGAILGQLPQKKNASILKSNTCILSMLPNQDSNPNYQSQNLGCYHYTIGQFCECKSTTFFLIINQKF